MKSPRVLALAATSPRTHWRLSTLASLALAMTLPIRLVAAQSTPDAGAPPSAETTAVAADPPVNADETPVPPAVPPTPVPVVEPTVQQAAGDTTGSDTDRASPTPADGEEEPWTLEPPRVFGYIQVQLRTAFHTGEDPLYDNTNFRVQRARLGVEGDLFPWLSYDVEFDPRAPEITGILRDAFFTLHFIPHHRIRIGQQKTQFGYENRESSTRLFAVNRTEVSDNLSRGTNLRDIGIGLIGHINLGSGFRFEDAITVVNGNGMNTQLDDTPMKDFWGRIGLRYKRHQFWARLGFSGAIGDHIDPGDDDTTDADNFLLRFRRLGADVEVDQKWFFLSAEVVVGWDQPDGLETEMLYGWYINLVGKTPWDIGPIVRYDAADGASRFTFGAYYGKPNSIFRVMLNYELRLLLETELQARGGIVATDLVTNVQAAQGVTLNGDASFRLGALAAGETRTFVVPATVSHTGNIAHVSLRFNDVNGRPIVVEGALDVASAPVALAQGAMTATLDAGLADALVVAGRAIENGDGASASAALQGYVGEVQAVIASRPDMAAAAALRVRNEAALRIATALPGLVTGASWGERRRTGAAFVEWSFSLR